MIELQAANQTDVVAICTLLKTADLLTEGVEEHIETFVKLVHKEMLVGTAGMEVYGQNALLRSVALSPNVRGQGHGKRLVNAILKRAQEMGISELYLLTETAQNFFTSLHFETIPRTEADTAVQRSEQFQSLCPDSATCMRLKIS